MTTSHLSGWKRLAIALGIVLAGVALIPYVALPSERFSWQLFANVYNDGPHLASNYDIGAPGSSFTITGFNFPANQALVIRSNGYMLGTTASDDIGGFQIRITSDADTDEGFYQIEAGVEEESGNKLSQERMLASLRLQLSAAAPLRSAEGAAPAFALPDQSAANLIFIPLGTR